MTHQNPTPGNDPGMSAYLDEMQSKSLRLSGVVAAIAPLESEDACREGKVALIYLA